MSPTDQSFDALRQAIQSLWPEHGIAPVDLSTARHMLLLSLPGDIAAFSVLNGRPDEEFNESYGSFRQLYREHNRTWDEKTLSFVVCRSSDRPEDDRFYASLEQDSLFCRKYVIRAFDDVEAQRDELLRLPFLPLDAPGENTLQRPPSAQDLLQSAGISPGFSRKLIESGVRSAERIASDLRDGNEVLPESLGQPSPAHLALIPPRAHSRLTSMTVAGFRVYRDEQTFDLDASVIVLYGPNGLGKTSFFDAIDYAATGRIGRLCRYQKRNATEFARLATHLDKTPGTGSVVLKVRSGSNDKGRVWKLQRGTGNWSSAWIDGEEVDRKTVIGSLTQANWLDAAPRQQNLESLFRATHLFGQGEQEILTEFSQNSVIPESFVSEMLALQDYTQGLSKVGEVLSRLENEQGLINQELAHLRSNREEIKESLLELGAAASEAPQSSPLEEAIAALREQIQAAGLNDNFPSDNPDGSKVSEWHELMSAQLAAIERRIESAHSLRNELPSYARLKENREAAQEELEAADQELQKDAADEQAIANRAQANAKAIAAAEGRHKQLNERRRVLRLALQAQAERDDLRKQVTGLAAERDKQVLARTESDTRLAAAESALSKASATQSQVQRALSSARAALSNVEKLLADLPQAEQDRKNSADLRARLADAQRILWATEEREKAVAKQLHDTSVARQALQPAYERNLSQQADLDRLLDSIQMHVHGDACPLCGSQYNSVDDLLERIRRHRKDAASQESDTSIPYKALTAEENQKADLIRVVKTEVAAAKSRIQELTDLIQKAARRLEEFERRLGAVLKDSIADTVRQELERHCQQLQSQRDACEQAAAAATREHQAAMTAQADEKDRRRAVQDRIAELEQQIQTLTDEIAKLDARMLQATPVDAGADYSVSAEIQRVDGLIEEALSSTERLQVVKREETAQQEAIVARKGGTAEKRKKILTQLAELHQKIAAFRKQLESLGLPDNADLNDLKQTIEREESLVVAVRALLEKGRTILNALQAREKRLRFLDKQEQLKSVDQAIAGYEKQRQNIRKGISISSSIQNLLRRERESAVKRHVSAYGPMITKIQQRLRSVYGFGRVDLEPRDGQAVLHVEWRNKNVQVYPTDFFSDSQKQILMLSIFLAGGLRQNWSGFAPVLLDDPVTHFDDLNVYGFIELVRGIVSTSPNEWQFIISTCEDRLFRLMQKKFSKVPSGANFYQFTGMSEAGPIIERR
jgi:DNA repair protein SbcC/Rad50